MNKNNVNIETIKIEDIKPYWKNPRNHKKAVDKVKESIQRFGYNVPIIVDTENIIIAGHTRYKALQKLGVKQVDCVVKDMTEEEARKFRIVDNKTSEFAEWDDTALKYELASFDDIGDIDIYFDDKELDDLLGGMIIDSKELSDIADDDFDLDIDYSDIKESDDNNIVSGSNVDSSDKDIQQVRAERQERLEKRRAKQQEQLDKARENHREQFTNKSDDTQNDYVDLQCPYCGEVYTLSLAELKRKMRYKENATFE